MLRLYLDVDGVLLLGQKDGRVVLAPHAAEFVDFALARFEVYWLTTHCAGDAKRVLDYLRRYANDDVLDRLAAVKPTHFDVLKTEALEGEFYWIDDSPLRAEIDELARRGMVDRWIEVNTRERPNDLLFARDELMRIVEASA